MNGDPVARPGPVVRKTAGDPVMRPARTMLASLAALAVLATAAAPVLADYTYGCTLPMIPQPESLRGESFDARGLVMFIQERGLIEIKSDKQKTLQVRSTFAILGPGGREKMTQGTGDTVEISVGRHPIARASGDVFPKLRTALERIYGRSQFVLRSVTTVDHDKSVSSGDALVLTLEFVNAKPAAGEPVNSHKLAFFMGAGEGDPLTSRPQH